MNAEELADFVRQGLIARGKLPGGPPVAVERGTHYPDVPPALPDEDAVAYTDRLTGADGTGRQPYDHLRNRQCSIGYHPECSDDGTECQCPHHLDMTLDSGVTATDHDVTLARLYYLPITTARNVMSRVHRHVMTRAVLADPPDDSDEEPDHLSFEEVKDVIAGARPHYSRPGDGFTVDVLRISGLAKFVRGMP